VSGGPHRWADAPMRDLHPRVARWPAGRRKGAGQFAFFSMRSLNTVTFASALTLSR
jgi:hypothetical protein